ncbi:MAG: YARHG domain-containing protein [Hyphomicrobiales bacterium]|nr:MAG: YARHG domain-containing protein [Hyphomicrobiales bacterium]
MRRTLLTTASLGLLLGLAAIPAPAWAETCDDLWYARNEIYKAQGYCFRTRRGIEAFGNAGCRYDNAEDLPLSNSQRRSIAEIQREERARRCPR